jgi:hypothetical protein
LNENTFVIVNVVPLSAFPSPIFSFLFLFRMVIDLLLDLEPGIKDLFSTAAKKCSEPADKYQKRSGLIRLALDVNLPSVGVGHGQRAEQ